MKRSTRRLPSGAFVCGLVVAALAPAGVSRAQGAGGAVYDFLLAEPGARAAAMGGSFVARQDDVTGLFYNPAAIGPGIDRQASVSYQNHVTDIQSGFLAYGRTLPRIGSLAVGLRYTNYGQFDETDENANALGTFSAQEMALTLGYGYEPLTNLRLGLSGSLIYSGLAKDASSSGIAADLGALYTVPTQGFTVGASLRNLGTQLTSYGSEKESLPLSLELGVSKQLTHLPITIDAGLHRINGEANSLGDRLGRFSVGAELTPAPPLRLRVGYLNNRREALRTDGSSALDLAGLSFGAGVTWRAYILDYAFTSYSAVGSLHQLSLRTTL